MLLIVLGTIMNIAKAQDVHHHDGMSPDVDQFYSTWKVPNSGGPGVRQSFCCNKKDCAPADIKHWQGQWYGRRATDVDWHLIPDALLESNQGDPLESPDGRSHICVSTSKSNVLCAVLGSGQ